MKTKIFIKFFLLATIFFAFSFATFSCSDLISENLKNDSDEKNLIEISGNFCVNGAVPSEIAASFSDDADCNIKAESSSSETESSSGKSENFFSNTAETQSKNARTAVPSINENSLYYKVTATSENSTVQGEVNRSSKTFTIKLSSGSWNIKAQAFSQSSMLENTKVLEGQTNFILQPNSNPVKNDISITLSPVNSGRGTIDLTVNFENETNINSVEMILTKVGSTSSMQITGSDSAGNQKKLTKENIESGVYNAVLNFKYSTATNTEELKYQVHEVVNVFSNLTTDTWQGNAPYFTKTNGKTEFKITKSLVDGFINRKEFYVQGTSGTYVPATAASGDNSGTYFDPFETIQQAVDIINDINDETSTYTIKVDGTVEITSQSDSSAVIIQPDKNLNLTIESHSTAKATVKANPNDKMRVFIVGNGGNTSITPNVTMKNLIITGGNNETGGGAGIKLEAGNLTLSNVEVTSNSTTYGNGGGIYVGLGNCTINGGTISNNSAESNGGGIYVGGGTLTINGTNTSNATMSGNKLTDQQDTGTAIFVGRGATAELNGSSGNINITPGIAPGGALPTIYLEKGQQGSLNSGGSGGSSAIPDAVLKLGGNVQIGNGSGTGIKIGGKIDQSNANIKITDELTTQTINISYDDAQLRNPIIESEESWQLTQEDCDKFRVRSSNIIYRLTLDSSTNRGICAMAF